MVGGWPVGHVDSRTTPDDPGRPGDRRGRRAGHDPGVTRTDSTDPATARRGAGTPRSRHLATALLVDVALVLLFAAIGRGSHGESVLTGLAGTAWPFLLGLAAGWSAALAIGTAGRRAGDPARVVPAGLLIWGGTLVIGMLARVVAGQGTAPSFIVVAGVVLAVFLLGWRMLAAVVGRRRHR